jgi:cytochrome oxidase Cu insertion factor (SCO1/SenC/PrrC family)
MKVAVALLFLAATYISGIAQEKTPTNDGVPSSVGLKIGQQAPAFALPDQLGHERTNETLKGSKGTVLLFFRSADW